MLKATRLLQFPARPEPAGLSANEAQEIAQRYLSDTSEPRPDVFSDADVLSALCVLLKGMLETSPTAAAAEAGKLYTSITTCGRPLGLFDEHNYFLGEIAVIAASAFRFVGKFDESARWLDRAEAAFRHTINPTPLLTNLAYARLALRYALGRYDDVLELLPSLANSFVKLGMELEEAKCRFLEAKTLIQLGKPTEALPVLTLLQDSRVMNADRILSTHVLIQAGNCNASGGHFDEAASLYSKALVLIQGEGPSVLLAELKWSIGDTRRSQNQPVKALEAYRAAQSDYASLAMRTSMALLHLVSAETLLSLGRNREAEWEILAALPTIDEQRMVPEGFAAVALLRESVRIRKTDPNALRDLRERLQANS